MALFGEMKNQDQVDLESFLQFDADFVGTKSLQADAELCVMISEILEKCGLNEIRLYNKDGLQENN